MRLHIQCSKPYSLLIVFVLLVISETVYAACETGKLTVDGRERSYYACPLKNLNQDKPLPLVIALHGGYHNGKDFAKYTGLTEAAARQHFIVVYPDGTGKRPGKLTWNAKDCCGYAFRHNIDDVKFINVLIEHLLKKYKIDASRVFLTGMSNGAMLAYRVAAETPKYIAAIAAVSGTMNRSIKQLAGPLSVLHIHGTKDESVPYKGGVGPKSFTHTNNRSVATTLKMWVAKDRLPHKPGITKIPNSHPEDGTVVVKYSYGTLQDKYRVVHYKVINGGHTWPGHPPQQHEDFFGKTTLDIDANEVIWRFFKSIRNNK